MRVAGVRHMTCFLRGIEQHRNRRRVNDLHHKSSELGPASPVGRDAFLQRNSLPLVGALIIFVLYWDYFKEKPMLKVPTRVLLVVAVPLARLSVMPRVSTARPQQERKSE